MENFVLEPSYLHISSNNASKEGLLREARAVFQIKVGETPSSFRVNTEASL